MIKAGRIDKKRLERLEGDKYGRTSLRVRVEGIFSWKEDKTE